MEKERSLRTRALLAVFLFFGFYLLALFIAAVLALIPYLEWKAMHHITGRLALACLAGAGIILWSIAPRRDKFVPPGPRIMPEEHPRFFEIIESIAREVGRQSPPREVFLYPICNAWVASRGGIMGIGSRRVMAVGIPLLQTLSVPQFRAVLAHEFGHYCGGDVKLGPWIYKTRLAIMRTVLVLQARKSILQIPFVWYGNTFLKITNSISRGQELAADRTSASIGGAENAASALKRIDMISPAFDVYWQEYVIPALVKGFCPPIVTGFSQFLSSDRAKKLAESSQERPPKAAKPSPFDTHPTLDERLASLRAYQGDEKVEDTAVGASPPRAMTLLSREEPEVEKELLAWIEAAQTPALSPVSWQEVGQKVWREIWKEGADLFAAELVSPVTAADFPRLMQREPAVLPPAAGQPSEGVLPEVNRTMRIVYKYGSALAIAMIRMGWNIEVQPGERVSMEKGGLRFKPFEQVDKLAGGEIDEAAWCELCRDAGILDLRFG
jgi:heat shock protein HtpX